MIKEDIKMYIITLLMTLLVLMLVILGAKLAAVLFGVPSDTHVILFSLAFFSVWRLCKMDAVKLFGKDGGEEE